MLTFIFSPIVLLQRFLSLFQLSAWNRTTKKKRNINNRSLAVKCFSFPPHIAINYDEVTHSWQFTGGHWKNEYKITVYFSYVFSIFKTFWSIFLFKSSLKLQGFEKIVVWENENIHYNSSPLSNFTLEVNFFIQL